MTIFCIPRNSLPDSPFFCCHSLIIKMSEIRPLLKITYFIRSRQVWKDLQVRKALWELWEPWENRATQEQPDQQGPRAHRDPRDLQQLNPQYMHPPLVLQAKQVSCRCKKKKKQNKQKKQQQQKKQMLLLVC